MNGLMELPPPHPMHRVRHHALVCLLVTAAAAFPARGTELNQWVSRESVRIDPAKANIRVGRDGMVYVLTWKELQRGYVLRMAPDGSHRSGNVTGGSCMIATANARGDLGTSHWSWKGGAVEFRDREGRVLGREKLENSQIEAGDLTGDFYVRSEDSLLRVSTNARVVQRYVLDSAFLGKQPAVFRVSEKQEAFYVLTPDAALHCVRFDGKEAWRLSTRLSVEGQLGRSGQHVPFDVSEDGWLYVFDPPSGDIQVYDADSASLAPPVLKNTLNLPDDQVPKPVKPKGGGNVSDVCVAGTDLVIRRREVAAPDEFFQRYDRKTARLIQTVRADFVHLSVTYPDGFWTAGTLLPLKITVETPGERMEPRWRVWVSPFGSGEWRELVFDGKSVTVPADGTGLFRIRVSPELDPSRPLRWAPQELAVDGVVEIRAPGATGTLSLWTPASRPAYGRGEEIPVTVRLRSPDGGDRQVVVRLVTDDRRTTVAEWPVSVATGRDATVRVPATLTRLLGVGNYRLTAVSDGLSVAEQSLTIGPGLAPPAFQVLSYADYGNVYPTGLGLWDLADGTKAATEGLRKLGVTMAVDRFGIVLPPFKVDWDYVRKNMPVPWQQASNLLAADPGAAAPEKLAVAPCIPQTMAWYSAEGVQQMAILLNNDAGMPLGKGFDTRTPEEMCDSLRRVNNALLPYPAFRGWIWAANWFTFKGRGASAGRTDEEQAAYGVAMSNAMATGQWSPVLDTVCDLRLSWGTDAIKLFRKTLDEANRPDLRTSMSGPFRNVESYPPVTFAEVDEVDLQAQWEQVALPYHVPYAVDFYKRPGKPVLSHPELGNDNGTGDMFLPNAFAGIMRGADSMGFHYGWGYKPVDPRTSLGGCNSQNRAFLPLMKSLGPWLAAAQEKRDPVAIVASSRLFKTDRWFRAMGIHFARVFEAWLACMHAHYPASIVFSEDLKPDTLRKYKAVLVVGQWIEPEPTLAEALKGAAAAGVKVFYDGTSRESLMTGFTPLGFAFDQMEQDPSPAADEAAYWRLPRFIKADAARLAEKLAPVLQPTATTDNPEVLLTERVAEQGRYLFVVNNTTPDMDPGQLWRMSLFLTTRTPVRAALKWDVPDSAAVYELFAQKPVSRQDGAFVADLQVQPCRIFAALPAAIDRVALKGPATCRAGQKVAWSLQVQDQAGRALAAAVPACVRLISKSGVVLDSIDVSAGSKGASGEFQVPVGLAAGDAVLEAQERFSGKAARLVVRVEAGVLPVREQVVATVAGAEAQAVNAATFLPGPDERFGPHLRDLVVSDDGRTALMNAFNWDQNLHGVDVETGALRFQRRLGNYFTFEPKAIAGGFAVQGFDFNTAEGYHLYLLGADGAPARRFALTAFAGRLPHRFLTTVLGDRVNNFATAPDGSWVAAAGDLGLAVWDRGGKLLWSQEWWKTERKEVRLLAAAGSLLVFDDGLMKDLDPVSGTPRGEAVNVESAGNILFVARGGDTVFIGGDMDDGCILAVRDGKLAHRFQMKWSEFVPLPDGSGVVVTDKADMRLVSIETGLRWVCRADEMLRSPRVSPDGKRVVACSEFGTLYVVGVNGDKLLERDVGALAVPAWLPNGDLLLASWMGEVSRLDGAYQPKWRVLLRPSSADMRGKLLAADATPTARVTWSNAEREPLPLTPNVLSVIGAKGLQIRLSIGEGGFTFESDSLVDGQLTPASEPLLPWDRVVNFVIGTAKPAIEFKLKGQTARVQAITVAEDPGHPESWLRQFTVEAWDEGQQAWVHVQDCLSDAAVHTHRFTEPVTSSQFRLVLSQRFCGNLRSAEIALHGEELGAVKEPGAPGKAGGKGGGKAKGKAGGKAGAGKTAADPAVSPEDRPVLP